MKLAASRWRLIRTHFRHFRPQPRRMCVGSVLPNPSYHDQFAEQQGTRRRAPWQRGHYQQPSSQKQLVEGAEEAKQLRERSLPGFTDWVHRRETAQAAAALVWLQTISVEMGTELDIWGLSEIPIFFDLFQDFISIIGERKQSFVVFMRIRCFVDEFSPTFSLVLSIPGQIFIFIRT